MSVQSTKGNLLFLSVITLLPNNDKITNRILLRVGAIQLSTNVSSIKASLLAGNFFQVLTAVSVWVVDISSALQLTNSVVACFNVSLLEFSCGIGLCP